MQFLVVTTLYPMRTPFRFGRHLSKRNEHEKERKEEEEKRKREEEERRTELERVRRK